ncbi:MAG: hypothetical protein M3Q23_07925 [Actinomycetota bacterium]|nr:hypothetical protein [Actinomycetota bacterium]
MSETLAADRHEARALGRAWLLATGSVVSIGVLFLVSTQLRAVRAHSSWSNDPYDAVLSVAGLVLPFVWGVTSARLLRWSVTTAVPAPAIRTISRGLGVVLILVWASVAACLVALAGHARHGAWGPWFSWLVALVVATGLSAVAATVQLTRTERRFRPEVKALGSGWRADPAEPDALDDIVTLLGVAGTLLRGVTPRVGGMLSWAARTLAAAASAPWGPRRHRGAWCVGLAVSFGVALAAWHGVMEGGAPTWPEGLLAGAVLAATGTALVLVSYASLGGYLRLIRPESRARPR